MEQAKLNRPTDFWARVYADFPRNKVWIFETVKKEKVIEVLSVHEFREKYVSIDNKILTL